MLIEKDSTNPYVSVLMTIYNAESYLKEAIDSIISQTFENWELIAVDDGSTDNSPAILSNYKDTRIRVWINSTNIGRTPALRSAFEQSRGEYIAILDADDISHPERFARQVEYLNQHPDVGLVGSWAKRIDKHGSVILDFKPSTEKDQLYNSLAWKNPFVHSSIMYRKKLALQAGGYPKTYIYAQDYALILNIINLSQVAMIGEYLCKLRISNSSMTESKEYNKIRLMEGILLYEKAAEDVSLSRTAYTKNKCRLALLNFKLGWGHAKDREGSKAVSFIIEGIKNILLIFVNSRTHS